jgi:hypothetical protein
VPTLGPCPACAIAVSSAAVVCPHCGQPLAAKAPSKLQSRLIESVGVIGVLLVVVGYAYSSAEMGNNGFPRCDSSTGRSGLSDAIANAPLGKVLGLSIVDLKDIQTTEDSSLGVSCVATAFLSNSSEKIVHYSFKKQNGQIMVRANVDLLSK